jgi:hypothetical protein
MSVVATALVAVLFAPLRRGCSSERTGCCMATGTTSTRR